MSALVKVERGSLFLLGTRCQGTCGLIKALSVCVWFFFLSRHSLTDGAHKCCHVAAHCL